jgi:hypothetical protein
VLAEWPSAYDLLPRYQAVWRGPSAADGPMNVAGDNTGTGRALYPHELDDSAFASPAEP